MAALWHICYGNKPDWIDKYHQERLSSLEGSRSFIAEKQEKIEMIITLRDFCRYLYPTESIRDCQQRYEHLNLFRNSKFVKSCYQEILIPKRSGGERVLQVPSEELRDIQHGILRLLSCPEVDALLPPCVTAYRKGGSICANASPHLNAPVVVKLDIKDFFGSIGRKQIFQAVHRAIGVCPQTRRPKSVSEGKVIPSAPCNRIGQAGSMHDPYSRLFMTFLGIVMFDNHLPQGAPTSPLISNLAFRDVDCLLSQYCARHQINYTRYSDDMTFSGAFSPTSLISYVKRALSQKGFELNESKTHVLGKGDRRLVTGAVVNEKMQATTEYRHKIRQELYYIRRYGLQNHMERIGQTDAETYLRTLIGKLSFTLQLDPESPILRSSHDECLALLYQLRESKGEFKIVSETIERV